ncbi:hydrolase, NUDIX family, putative [Synechococcus sp. PCC 7335]|uniref:NUDIX hydrolase n=1 Tax=Synechococcus sp. (strain ATCC 29403 / PCC 7335) TaxID=91464 RepID=UPI00017ECAD8|nr:NUDIX hydrolase [Synechococcus sp. PCC 7335]EDX84119.1 hydrolase, NUDIX family, putative [Synechococcus sp. PCC 7335]
MAKHIRPIALGLIEHQNHLFVSQGQDKKTKATFYRFLGGGIDFGETSKAALVREFQEEIQAELTDIEYLSCLDNIFTLNDKPKHELIQLFRCRFVDKAFYQLNKKFALVEGDRTTQAFWIKTADVLVGQRRLVPESCLKYLTSQ